LGAIQLDNKSLWRDVAILRNQHHKQRRVIEKLIQFLLSLIKNRHNLVKKRRMKFIISPEDLAGSDILASMTTDEGPHSMGEVGGFGPAGQFVATKTEATAADQDDASSGRRQKALGRGPCGPSSSGPAAATNGNQGQVVIDGGSSQQAASLLEANRTDASISPLLGDPCNSAGSSVNAGCDHQMSGISEDELVPGGGTAASTTAAAAAALAAAAAVVATTGPGQSSSSSAQTPSPMSVISNTNSLLDTYFPATGSDCANPTSPLVVSGAGSASASASGSGSGSACGARSSSRQQQQQQQQASLRLHHLGQENINVSANPSPVSITNNRPHSSSSNANNSNNNNQRAQHHHHNQQQQSPQQQQHLVAIQQRQQQQHHHQHNQQVHQQHLQANNPSYPMVSTQFQGSGTTLASPVQPLRSNQQQQQLGGAQQNHNHSAHSHNNNHHHHHHHHQPHQNGHGGGNAQHLVQQQQQPQQFHRSAQSAGSGQSINGLLSGQAIASRLSNCQHVSQWTANSIYNTMAQQDLGSAPAGALAPNRACNGAGGGNGTGTRVGAGAAGNNNNSSNGANNGFSDIEGVFNELWVGPRFLSALEQHQPGAVGNILLDGNGSSGANTSNALLGSSMNATNNSMDDRLGAGSNGQMYY
jgi:hypothetical protein